MLDQLDGMNRDADPMWSKLQLAIRGHVGRALPRHEKMWAYYRNPIELVRRSGAAGCGATRGWYRSAQEVGLPARIVGVGGGAGGGVGGDAGFGGERGRREVVIENDIGWRVQAMVDFMLGSPVRIESLAQNKGLKGRIEHALERVWEESGGIAMMQDMATLGHIFGHVDLLVRVDEENLRGSRLWDIGRWISIEPVDARRGIAVLSEHDYREIELYAVHTRREVEGSASAVGERERPRAGWIDRLRGDRGERGGGSRAAGASGRERTDTEVFTREGWARYVDGRRVEGGAWALTPGRAPIVHMQNMSQPLVYNGIGEVEPLVGLQDELNTRLSDRASRVTMQSFKMYLAKGIEGFKGASVGPGMVWSTDNPEAGISSFGGDASSPSEESHVEEIREAMDKISGVPPLAGGVVRAKIGNLSSANALRITLMSLITKTTRKRVSYGRGIERASTMVLEALSASGVLPTEPSDRGVRVVWGELPVIDEATLVATGRAKVELGVDEKQILDELGYSEQDPGVV